VGTTRSGGTEADHAEAGGVDGRRWLYGRDLRERGDSPPRRKWRGRQNLGRPRRSRTENRGAGSAEDLQRGGRRDGLAARGPECLARFRNCSEDFAGTIQQRLRAAAMVAGHVLETQGRFIGHTVDELAAA